MYTGMKDMFDDEIQVNAKVNSVFVDFVGAYNTFTMVFDKPKLREFIEILEKAEKEVR